MNIVEVKNLDKVIFPIDKCVFTYHSRVERNFNVGSYVRPLIERLSQKGMKFIAISQGLLYNVEEIKS